MQDYEVSFYARGSRAIIAETTYDLGLPAICASPWLRSVLETRHNSWARHFFLSYDKGAYEPPANLTRSNPIPRIALYGRIGTERRCVELALLAVEELARPGIKFQADIFGHNGSFVELQCANKDHGVLPAEELGVLYRQCDLGICFSGTNYSLVPQEMMACGLPVVELGVESARSSIPENVVAFVPADPIKIADILEQLLADPEARRALSRRGLEWAGQHDWQSAARAVEAALLERLEAGFPKTSTFPVVANNYVTKGKPKASVLVPTLNGGALYEELLDRLAEQKTDFRFELIVVDSGSEDGTFERTRERPFATLHKIDRLQFQHGRTRNLLASKAAGEYMLFLTQDALPSDEFWLYNFVSTMDKFPEAAGGFGRHVAHKSAEFFTRKQIRDHFVGLSKYPLLCSKYSDIEKWNSKQSDFLQQLHFFSDNNSCLRRMAWEKLRFPEVPYGEDQLWAWQAAQRGWSKVYAPNAVVYHSHDYDSTETLDRAEMEAWFFRKYFGYNLEVKDMSWEHAERVAYAERVGRINNVSRAEIERRKRNDLAQLAGWRLGRQRADRELDVTATC